MGNKTVDAAGRLSCAEAGIEGLKFHDLRHAFASRLVQSGVPLYTVSKLPGQVDIETTQRSHTSRTPRCGPRSKGWQSELAQN